MGIFPEMLVCGDITATTSCTKLTRRHAVHQIGTLWLHSTWQQLLYSCSKYFGAKRCFLLNNARCKISQKLRLFSAIGHGCLFGYNSGHSEKFSYIRPHPT